MSRPGTSRAAALVAALLVAVLAAPFALNLAGDAQVHLAIAEAFAAGRPFQYNPSGVNPSGVNSGGEIVVASTSPFWTMLLSLYFTVAGPGAPLLLSLTAVAIWLSAGLVLGRVARDIWGMGGAALWAVVGLWLAHATIVANALGGLENALSALQLLLIYAISADGRPLTRGRAALIGLLLGWALLTRPDGGLLAVGLVGLHALRLIAQRDARPAVLLGRAALLIGVAAAVLLPWYAWQLAETGRLVTDSSVARLYNGRQGSLVLVPGLLYLHPKALLSLGSAFLPLVVGYVVMVGGLGRGVVAAVRGRARAAFYVEHYPRLAAALLVAAGLGFYTFVVGAEAFGRYFLPLFPFLFLAGVDGWRTLVAAWPGRLGGARVGRLLAVAALLFMATTSLTDAWRRLGPGRFAPERALDVVYGPANRQYYAANLPFVLAAPPDRTALTDGFLRDLGRDPAAAAPISIAVTEVQLRYFLDDRVAVYSLDGRTSADILRYTDPLSGVPDFERYFIDTRPDYVHAAQWCEVGGWLAGVLSLPIEDNLVCDWERRAATMRPGDWFEWGGRRVTLVAPQIVRIDW